MTADAPDPTARELRERAARTAPAMSVDLDRTIRSGRRRLARRRAGLGLAGLVVAAAVAVGGASLAPGLRDGTPPPVAEEPTAPPTATTEPETTYHCNDLPVPLEVLTEGRFATELTPESLAVLGAIKIHVPREWDTWRVLVESDTEITLIRPLPEDVGSGPLSHEVLQVAYAPVAGDDGSSGWAFRGSWSCAIMRDLGELANVDLHLPAEGAQTDGTQLTVMVTERSCTGGADPTDRLRLVDVSYTATTIEVVVGVEPLGPGAVTCIGNTPVPLVVPLDEPIAGRTIVDAARYPALSLLPQGAGDP